MIHSCGQSHLEKNIKPNLDKLSSNSLVIENFENSIVNGFNTSNIKLYSAYLGQVNVDATLVGDIVYLEKYHTVNNKQLLVKIVDAVEHNLSENNEYNLNKLKSLSSYKININENKYYYVVALMCSKKIAQISNNYNLVAQLDLLLVSFIQDQLLLDKIFKMFPELKYDFNIKYTKDYKKIYQKSCSYNSSVDVFFNTYNYLDFLFDSTQLVSVNNLDSLISISNVNNLDNAFFTGQYMVYGTGDKLFYPLSSIDVVGHELSHGLVSGTANLEYKGHSGALNESFADVMGTMFEFYMYNKYPYLNGKKDWFIGEDLGMDMPFLRSMEDPLKAQQPNTYKGQFYINPNSDTDFGGVHINSGIPNHCFYLASQQKDKNAVLSTFVKCLKSLNKNSNFIDFRDKLKQISNNDPIILEALNKVGLNDTVINDYNIQNQIPQPRTPIPIPQPRTPIPQPRTPIPQRPQFPQQPRPQFPPQPQPQPRPQFPPQPRPQFPPQSLPQPRPQFPQQPRPQFPRSL
jgi:hypothetical protein